MGIPKMREAQIANNRTCFTVALRRSSQQKQLEIKLSSYTINIG